ncbi:hypothetical protein GGR57DRAFT_500147 [Xylariaceae sp. FL1272]|nr:hypothetical protein GGR57DRAFT_500147 [Xylariaceae sp. FL1272]
MDSFIRFCDLPPELRMQIWKEHFLQSHGQRIHVFLSRSSKLDIGRLDRPAGPRYICLDAHTNLPASDQTKSAVTHEAWTVLRESFTIGDTKALMHLHALVASATDQTSMGDGEGQSWRAVYEAAANKSMNKYTVRFAMECERDLVYIIDQDVECSLFKSMCKTPWMRRVKYLAFQLCNIPSGFRASQHALWYDMVMNPTPEVRIILSSPIIKEVFLVVVPDLTSDRSQYYPCQRTFGFVDGASYPPIFQGNFHGRVLRHMLLIQNWLCEGFPHLKNKCLKEGVVDITCTMSSYDDYCRRFN